ncbi:MAG: regulatory protein RecX [Candidatus Acidiferrales bacterium]
MARRAHATSELRTKLEKRADAPADVERVLDHLAARGWLNDRRFASDYARARARHRRLGRYRIARELRQKGVDKELIEEALTAVFPAPHDEVEPVRYRIEKRLRRERPPYTQRVLRSLYDSLLRAGFSSTIIREELFNRPEFRRGDTAGEKPTLKENGDE